LPGTEEHHNHQTQTVPILESVIEDALDSDFSKYIQPTKQPFSTVFLVGPGIAWKSVEYFSCI
jgi:hypothetical protein